MSIYAKILNKYGIRAQRWILIEEMGEVMQAFSHEKRGRCDTEKVSDELVDLYFAFQTVRLHYMSDYEFNSKLRRVELKMQHKMED